MTRRAVQLDGLRAISMIAICWDHWLPKGWSRIFPFELFLFFFLVLTGYLITGGLLRERDRSEALGKPWRAAALKSYQIRRGLRILAPYYAALAFAWILRAPDMVAAPWWYVFHLSNLHIATLGYWPAGTSHFWSLAIQQQFYLIWPFVLWFVPRKYLGSALVLFALVAPISRVLHSQLETWVVWPQLLTWLAFDYFAIGGLLALAVHRGMSLESPVLRWIAWTGFTAYLVIFGAGLLKIPTTGFWVIQQTVLSIGISGFIAAAINGFRGPFGKILESAPLQQIGRLSYGVYLYHNLAPLAAGKILPWVFWNPWFETLPGALLRMALYAAITWVLTLASWRWIEQPLQGVRSKFAGGSAIST